MTFQQWKTKHSEGLAKGTLIYTVIKPPGLTLDEQDKWRRGLRPAVGVSWWATDDDGWREVETSRQESQCSERERKFPISEIYK